MTDEDQTAASKSPETEPYREVDPKLLEILVCPVTRGTLHYDREAQELISYGAALAYAIKDGIPIMLPDEARPLSEAERARGKAKRPSGPSL